MNGPADVAEACSDDADTFFQPIESDATDTSRSRQVRKGIIATVDDTLPFPFNYRKLTSVR